MKSENVFVVIALLMIFACIGISDLMADNGSAKENIPEEKNVSTATDLVKKVKYANNKEYMESRKVVQDVGRKGSQDQVPQLKAVVRTIAETARDMQTIAETERSETIAFDALHSLWLLKEPKAFFLETANNYHKTKPMLAYYAIHILAYNPANEVWEELSKIEHDSPNSRVVDALGTYQYVLQISHRYSQMTDIKEKVELLVNTCLLSGWSIFGGSENENNEPSGYLRPIAVWSWQPLLQLSEQEPSLVAQIIFTLKPSVGGKPPYIDIIHDYIIRFVGDRAKAHYKELKENSK
jgi:hypothetical protein